MPNPPVARRAGGIGYTGGEQTIHSRTPAYPQAKLRQNLRFRRLTARVHELGPRPCAEVMLAVAQGRDLVSVLESFAEIDEQLLDEFQGRTWPPLPMRVVP
jgi:hypothetical protein